MYSNGDDTGYFQCALNYGFYNPRRKYTTDALIGLLKLVNQNHLPSVVCVTTSLLLLH